MLADAAFDYDGQEQCSSAGRLAPQYQCRQLASERVGAWRSLSGLAGRVKAYSSLLFFSLAGDEGWECWKATRGSKSTRSNKEWECDECRGEECVCVCVCVGGCLLSVSDKLIEEVIVKEEGAEGAVITEELAVAVVAEVEKRVVLKTEESSDTCLLWVSLTEGVEEWDCKWSSSSAVDSSAREEEGSLTLELVPSLCSSISSPLLLSLS